MKLCHICLSSDKIWTLDGSNVYATTDTVMYLCDACNSAMRKQCTSGIHVPTALWVVKRIKKMRITKHKADLKNKDRDIEALTQLCQRQNKELRKLRSDE
jgi:hypothetical protein